jgi:hypothetical protein
VQFEPIEERNWDGVRIGSRVPRKGGLAMVSAMKIFDYTLLRRPLSTLSALALALLELAPFIRLLLPFNQ